MKSEAADDASEQVPLTNAVEMKREEEPCKKYGLLLKGKTPKVDASRSNPLAGGRSQKGEASKNVFGDGSDNSDDDHVRITFSLFVDHFQWPLLF